MRRLYPSERIEVTPLDLFQSVVKEGSGISVMTRPLELRDVDTMTGSKFEAVVAALWTRRGFDVVLTPESRDFGADVIAESENGNLLIQVKTDESNCRCRCHWGGSSSERNL